MYLPYTWPGGQRRRPAPQRAAAGTLARLRYTPGTSPASRRAETSAGARKLKPRYGAPAALSPPPPSRKAGNEVEPPAVLRVTASRSRFWHPRPAPVGDLDPDNAVQRLDHDRDRLAGGTRAAMPQAIGEKLAHQQGGHVPARVPGTEHLADEGASGPRPLRPPGKRHALPDRRHPGHHRTRPSPAAPPPGNRPGSGRTQGHARSAQPRTSSRRNGLRRPRPWTRPWSRPPSVAVRGNADGAHRPSQLCTPTVLTARTPVRYASVDSAT